MAAHSPLAARLAEEAGFEAIWASGFELAALFGLPDASIVSMTQHLDMVRAITSSVAVPVIADLDTGFGNAINARHAVREYERAGVAAVVLEDKCFPKASSLLADARHALVSIEEFTGKLEAAAAARTSADLVIVGRTEALIAGLGVEEALRRARAYATAGADMILVHSKRRTPDEIVAFADGWDGSRPLVIVPTAYPEFDARRISAFPAIGLVIYGNHGIRACVAAMQRTFRMIRADGGIARADGEIAPVEEVFRLQGMEDVARAERRYVR